MPLRVSQISPDVHRLFTRYTNWYLLEAGGRFTVLDAGLPGDWREFSSALGRLGHSPSDIDAVLITHHHPDHAGNAERLRSSGARVFAHPADAWCSAASAAGYRVAPARSGAAKQTEIPPETKRYRLSRPEVSAGGLGTATGIGTRVSGLKNSGREPSFGRGGFSPSSCCKASLLGPTPRTS